MIKVSVICITYNHQAYIRQALDGFVMQKTNFPFEVIVHDDASTDGTADIIREYEQKYPDIIKPVYQKENQWSQGKPMSKTFIYPKLKGEYVALCEGDDYWTDENKLQKQVDFLDAHPDFSICFHPVMIKWEDNSQPDSIYPSQKMLHNKSVFDFNDLIKGNFIQTNSVMYRWRFHKDSVDIIADHILPRDWFLHLLHAEVGKIGILTDVMAVYRRHPNGIWFGANENPEWICKGYVERLNFYDAVEKKFKLKPLECFYLTVYTTYYASMILDRSDILNYLLNKYDFLPKESLNIKQLKVKRFWLKMIGKILPYPRNIKYKTHRYVIKLYFNWNRKYG